MSELAVIIGLMLATVLLVGVGERIRLPYPVLVTVLGIAVALIPGLPVLVVPPELILPLFLPPLLYATAQRTSWSMFKVRWRSILLLAVVLVLITVAAVAVTAWLLVPGITIAAAVALGALTAPPDPVAAEAVAGPLRMPRRLVAVLQSEGLFNDAVALVIYQLAVAAAVTGSYSPWGALLRFVYSAPAAVVLGLALGWVARWVLTRTAEATARSGLTLVIPFAAYLLAESVHASGVLAVVTVALYIGHTVDESDVDGRLSGGAFWEVVELLVTGVAFGLIGLELREVLTANEGRLLEIGGRAALICVVVIVVRTLWLGMGAWLVGRSGDPERAPRNWREGLVLSWCGMRGLATLALALAIPLATDAGAEFPARAELLLIAFAVIVVTMVLPGLTLPALVKVLGVQAESDAEQAADELLAKRAYKAGIKRLKELDAIRDLPEDMFAKIQSRQKGLLAALYADKEPQNYEEEQALRIKSIQLFREIQIEVLAAARREVLKARTEAGTDPQAVDRVLRRIDLRSAQMH
ncbi:Na+/H+ antiporter [Allokutzneria oryzae]|uniref:Na+/H+ antiporter n=1 Tax=Allokutzneria oryzae TaxID=1378989 RepID=A0ABV5ZPA1_9PSEU